MPALRQQGGHAFAIGGSPDNPQQCQPIRIDSLDGSTL
jgi:hypothetical protein